MDAQTRFVTRLGLEYPILQAPIGPIAKAELAAAVSRAGGLGSVGMSTPARLTGELRRAREAAPKRPIAIGLVLRFTLRVHAEAVLAARPNAVILMDGFAPKLVPQLRAAGVFVLHQVGSREQAERAFGDGADGLIAQGVESGGHVLGWSRGPALLRDLRELAGDKPVLLAGGIADAQDVRSALAQGAAGVVAGTRYLLTPEADAHPAYKKRVLGAPRTLLTQLFGIGWSLKHRVVPNAATDRYCDEHGGIPAWVRLVHRVSEPFGRTAYTREDQIEPRDIGLPLFVPSAPDAADSLECAALYAGESVRRITSITPAEQVTRELAGKA